MNHNKLLFRITTGVRPSRQRGDVLFKMAIPKDRFNCEESSPYRGQIALSPKEYGVSLRLEKPTLLAESVAEGGVDRYLDGQVQEDLDQNR